MGARITVRRRAMRGAMLTALLVVLPVGVANAAPVVSVLSPGRSPVAGIQDDRIIVATDPAARMRLLADAGAALTRVDLRWDLVARAKPLNPSNPADPAYDWRQYDAIVAAARTYGVEVLFAVYGTPDWARDPSVPLEAQSENWTIRPQRPGDFGAFGEAAARRYGPLGVTKWEAWNEANIKLFLRPQYSRSGGRWVATSPETYSGLLTAFYAGVKRADPSAIVAGGVTAPAGDRCPDCPDDAPPIRVPPDDFMLALAKPGLRPPMDVVSHHPYPITRPRDFTPSGRTYIDLYNLSVFTSAIDRTYLKGKPLWLTEYGFATRRVPAYGTFFSAADQARHIADAYRRIKATPRVRVLVYYLLQDHATWASGTLDESGKAKLGYQALSLPFAPTTPPSVRRGSAITLVGQARAAPGVANVRIQHKTSRGWVTLTTVRTARDGSFRVRVRPTAALALRARWDGKTRTGTVTRRISPTVGITVR